MFVSCQKFLKHKPKGGEHFFVVQFYSFKHEIVVEYISTLPLGVTPLNQNDYIMNFDNLQVGLNANRTGQKAQHKVGITAWL